jgi:hypothetical protein
MENVVKGSLLEQMLLSAKEPSFADKMKEKAAQAGKDFKQLLADEKLRPIVLTAGKIGAMLGCVAAGASIMFEGREALNGAFNIICNALGGRDDLAMIATMLGVPVATLVATVCIDQDLEKAGLNAKQEIKNEKEQIDKASAFTMKSQSLGGHKKIFVQNKPAEPIEK